MRTGIGSVLLCVRLVEDLEHAFDRMLGIRPLRSRREVQIQLLVLGVTDELPVVDEVTTVSVAEVIEHEAARDTDASRHFEQLDSQRDDVFRPTNHDFSVFRETGLDPHVT
jgi:hypothetical protein